MGKTRWPPWPLIGWSIFHFSSETANRIQQNLTGSKIWTSFTKFVFFGPIGKTRWPPWPLIGWNIFHFSSETAKQNSAKLDRKQDLIVLYQVCVFQTDRKNKMATLTSDLRRHFRLILLNRRMEFNETWQEERSLCPLQCLCCSCWSKKNKMAALASDWLIHLISTSTLKLLNAIQRNLTGSKISTSSSKLVFTGRSVNDFCKNRRPGRFLKKVAHCTQVHDMWSFLGLLFIVAYYISSISTSRSEVEYRNRCVIFPFQWVARSYFFFSPPAHLCAVTYMTEISLIVTLNNQFTLPYLTLSVVEWAWFYL